jgi:hypothetical protein
MSKAPKPSTSQTVVAVVTQIARFQCKRSPGLHTVEGLCAETRPQSSPRVGHLADSELWIHAILVPVELGTQVGSLGVLRIRNHRSVTTNNQSVRADSDRPTKSTLQLRIRSLLSL